MQHCDINIRHYVVRACGEPILFTNSESLANLRQDENPGSVVEIRLGNKTKVDTLGD